jgi:hypothetical protein
MTGLMQAHLKERLFTLKSILILTHVLTSYVDPTLEFL